MIELKLSKTVLCFDFSFFAVLALFFCFNNEMGIIALLSCIFHEFGHLIVMSVCNVTVERMLFYGGGIRITADTDRLLFVAKISVLAAGCMFNVLLAAVLFLFGAETAAFVNIMTALLNLLPFAQLDGSQLAETVLYRFLLPYKADRYLMIIRAISLIITAWLLLSVSLDLTLICFVIYLYLIKKQYI